MKKKVLLVGGRSKARSLALSLIKRGYNVTVVNQHYEDCQKLAEIDGLTVVHGDGTKAFVLEDADAANAAIAIALTSKDEDNLVICELCKKKFHIPKTVSLLSDPAKTEFFYRMGIDSVVCAIAAITAIIEQQAFLEEIANVMPIGQGRLQLAEIPIPSTAPVVGKKLWEIKLPQEVIIGCILRGDKALIPRGDSHLLAGDSLVLISASGQERAAIKVLTGR